jgi:hypothetical protein
MDDLFPSSYSFMGEAPSEYPWASDLFGPVDENEDPLLVTPDVVPPAVPDLAALAAAAAAAHAAGLGGGGGGGGGPPPGPPAPGAPVVIDPNAPPPPPLPDRAALAAAVRAAGGVGGAPVGVPLPVVVPVAPGAGAAPAPPVQGPPPPPPIDMNELRAFIQNTLDHLRHTFGGMTAGITEGYAQLALRINRLAAALEQLNALHPDLDARDFKEDESEDPPTDYHSISAHTASGEEGNRHSEGMDEPAPIEPPRSARVPVPAPIPPFATPGHAPAAAVDPDLPLSGISQQQVTVRADRSIQRGNQFRDPEQSAEAMLESLGANTYPLIQTRNAAYAALLAVIFEKGLQLRAVLPRDRYENPPEFTTGSNQLNIQNFQRFLRDIRIGDRPETAMNAIVATGTTNTKPEKLINVMRQKSSSGR